MNILFVNEKRGYFGGVEQNVADTARGLSLRGHKCFLAYGNNTEKNIEEYNSIFESCFPCSDITPDAGHKDSFEEIINITSPDVIYFHKIAELPDLGKIPSDILTVRMVHDHDLCCPRKHKYFAINGRVCKHKLDWRCWLDGAFLARGGLSGRGLKFVNINGKVREMRRNHDLDMLLVGSSFMKNELLTNGFPEEKVNILPPVVSLSKKDFTPLRDSKEILYVGQLIRGKGVDLLLKALAQVSCQFTAVIVGTGNAESKLKLLRDKLKLNDKVRFQGWVNYDDIGKFYSNARAVAVPSRWPEPFGMVGLEAMNYSRPTIGFAVGGIVDWLEHQKTGLILPEQDIKGLSQAIETLLTNDDLAASMGRKAYKTAQKKYSFNLYLEKMETYLQKMRIRGST